MSKRILCLLVSFILLLPVMTACSSSKKEEDEGNVVKSTVRDAKTVCLYVITEPGTTAEAEQQVEDAINRLTKAKYTTRVDITYLTEDVYYQTLEAQFAKMKAQGKQAANTADVTGEAADTAEETDATIVNENGVTEVKYPDAADGQVDVFLIADYDKYLAYVQDGWLMALNDSLKNTYKKLNDYVYPSFLSAATVNKLIYGVPNNHMIGESCQYLLLREDLVEEYGLETSRVHSLSDCMDFLTWVKDNKTDVTPVLNEISLDNVAYLNVDKQAGAFTDTFSLVGTMQAIGRTGAEAGNLLEDEAYTEQLLALGRLKLGGYYGDGTQTNADYAAAFKTGTVYDECPEGYVRVILHGDTATAEDLCCPLFAVSKYTSDLTRSMEVLTYLNTNADMRNLLQYGVENVHYSLDLDTGALSRLNKDYNMKLAYTGNTYLAYPEETMPLSIWETAKMQNLASYTAPDFYDFEIPTPGEEDEWTVDYTSSDALAQASAEFRAALAACTTYADYEALVKAAPETYGAVIRAFLAPEEGAKTPFALYQKK